MPILLTLAEAAHGEVHFLLDPHGAGLAFWTLIVFVLVLLILYAKAWTPIMEALDRREQSIAGQVEDAARVRAEAERLKDQYEAQLEQVRQEAQNIINEGEADKQRIISDAQVRANEEAVAIRERAERDIHLAKQKALAEVKADAIKLGMMIAERVIAAEVDAKRHQAIVDEVLASYERS